MRIRNRMKAFSLIILLLMNLFGLSNFYIVRSKAATFDEINQSDVFLKQVNGDKQCTLVAATMLIRRAALLLGDTSWANITVEQVKKQAWVDGVGLKYTFTYGGITVNKAQFGANPATEAIALLQEHPEGIIIYDQNRIPRSHAVLLTDYTNETFYCADPAEGIAYGRIQISQGLVQIQDAEFYYYISSPSIPSLTTSAPSANDGSALIPVKDMSTYEVCLSQADYYYDGDEKRPEVLIDGLVENIDYTVSYFNNIYPGKAAVLITGMGTYSGNIIKVFDIREATIYDYLNEINVKVTKQTINKGKTATINVSLPKTLTLVKDFSNQEQENNHEVKITYTSANSKIAKVSSKGKITGIKKGNAKIKVTAELADGTKKVFTVTIKVK